MAAIMALCLLTPGYSAEIHAQKSNEVFLGFAAQALSPESVSAQRFTINLHAGSMLRGILMIRAVSGVWGLGAQDFAPKFEEKHFRSVARAIAFANSHGVVAEDIRRFREALGGLVEHDDSTVTEMIRSSRRESATSIAHGAIQKGERASLWVFITAGVLNIAAAVLFFLVRGGMTGLSFPGLTFVVIGAKVVAELLLTMTISPWIASRIAMDRAIVKLHAHYNLSAA